MRSVSPASPCHTYAPGKPYDNSVCEAFFKTLKAKAVRPLFYSGFIVARSAWGFGSGIAIQVVEDEGFEPPTLTV